MEDYMFSKIEIDKDSKDELLNLLKTNSISDRNQFSTLQTILEVGDENLDDL